MLKQLCLLAPESMRVTVITPTFNRAHLVGNAIRSVLAQSHSDFEHFVVDDGSTDNTRDIVAQFDDARLTYLEQCENCGQAAARNLAISQATGEVIAFMDSDDTWLATKLEEQVAIMATHPEVDVLFGDRMDVEGEKRTRRYVGIPEVPSRLGPMLLMDNVVNFNSSMVRASLLKRYKFDAALRAGEDYDLWLRMAPEATFLFKARPWLNYSMAGGRVSEDFEPVFRNNERSMRKAIDRGGLGIDAAAIARIWSRFYVRYARHHLAAGQRSEAIRLCLRAIRYRPLWLASWRALLAAMLRGH